jgi:hypothetical protein
MIHLPASLPATAWPAAWASAAPAARAEPAAVAATRWFDDATAAAGERAEPLHAPAAAPVAGDAAVALAEALSAQFLASLLEPAPR